MRLKLVFSASLIAALVGAGATVAIVLFVFSSLESIRRPGLLMLATYLCPVLTTLLASIFVYRHTARRRKFQAALTALITILLSLAFLLASSIFSSRNVPANPDPNVNQRVVSR